MARSRLMRQTYMGWNVSRGIKCARDRFPDGSTEVQPSCRCGAAEPQTATCKDVPSIGYAPSAHDVCHQSSQAKRRELEKFERTNGGVRRMLTSDFIGLLTGPHQTSSFEESSSTMRLSEGERPVLAPEYAESAPDAVMAEPVSYTRASS
jgi:hypothetical protein